MMRWLGSGGVEGWRGIGIAATEKVAMGRVSKSRIGWYRVDRRKGESTVEPKECRYGQMVAGCNWEEQSRNGIGNSRNGSCRAGKSYP